ncbi:MAG: efflux RND transporter permease subunit, partial [Candidatus Gastranaerophilales bacterium]|nr:efflux RND transporter permease subunit [Candidatus Gastranaerophilales bacterium]
MGIKKKDLYFFIQKPRFAVVISILITIVGLLSLTTLQQEKYPNITPPQVLITASYPGASADVVESSVASLLESQINGVDKMLYMNSTSSDESYSLSIFFETGTDSDVNLMNTQTKLQQAQSLLPQEVVQQGITAQNQVSGIGAVIVNLESTDGSWSQLDLTNYADIYIKDAFKRIHDVGNVNIYGTDEYSMRIWLNPDKMANLKISPTEILNAVRLQNIQLSTGSLGERPNDTPQSLKLSLLTTGRLKTPEEFGDIIIRANSDGSLVRLKEVAKVELGSKTYTKIGLVDAKPGVLIQGVPTPTGNTVEIVKNINKEIKKISKTLPDTLKINTMMDNAIFIEESMKEVVFTIFLTSLIVILVIFIFLGDFMATLIPCVTIPVSLIGTFAILKMLNMTLNLLT